jgi:hypothetical protein
MCLGLTKGDRNLAIQKRSKRQPCWEEARNSAPDDSDGRGAPSRARPGHIAWRGRARACRRPTFNQALPRANLASAQRQPIELRGFLAEADQDLAKAQLLITNQMLSGELSPEQALALSEVVAGIDGADDTELRRRWD